MNKQVWAVKVVAAVLVLTSILAGCTSNSNAGTSAANTAKAVTAAADTKKVLNVALDFSISKLDPHFSSSAGEFQVVQPIFNGLVRYKPGTGDIDNIEGDLAESWEVSEDGMTFTFHLRKGVKWQQGYGELTSADVKWSIERVMNPETGSPSAATFKDLDTIETPDDYTVVMHLKQRNAAFILNLIVDGGGGGAIVKKEAIEAAGQEYMVKPVGTGPFMLQEYKANEKVVLTKNPDYFRGEAKLDEIDFMIMQDSTAIEVAMEKGTIQMAPGIPDQLWLDSHQKEGLTIDIPAPATLWAMYLNTQIEPLNDIRVRKAIAHAIDMKSYVESLGSDVAHLPTTVIPSYLEGSSSEIGIYDYDPEKSKALLKEAGYPNGIKLPTMTVPTSTNFISKATYVQEQLSKVGIDMELNQTDVATFMGVVFQNQNPITIINTNPKPQAGLYLYGSFYGPSSIGLPTSSFNLTHYNKSDDLIVQAIQEMDKTQANELYKQIQQQIKDEYVALPIAEISNVLVRSNKVDLGYELKATSIFRYPIYETTDIKE